jgi:hypothetical protein
MVMTNRGRVVTAFVLALGLAGCKGKEQRQAAEDSTAARSDSNGAPSAPIALPHAVETAEAEAEDIQADIDQGAWPAAEAKLAVLRSLADSLAAQGVPGPRRAAFGSALDTLSAVIVARSKAYALAAANRVSRIVTGMMAEYPTKVPSAVTYMDVAGRDALYDVQQSLWSEAAAAALELGRNYAAVEAHVQARDSTLDRRVTSEIQQLQDAVGARSRGGAAKLAQALLDDVDLIEQTY